MKRKAGNQEETFHLTVQGRRLELQRIPNRWEQIGWWRGLRTLRAGIF
jgi:hypothetical protein